MSNEQLPELTERQHAIIRHALGIRDGKPRYRVHGPGYRNHFCTGEGSKDFADCEALVAAGVMKRHTRDWTPDYIYVVTDSQKFTGGPTDSACSPLPWSVEYGEAVKIKDARGATVAILTHLHLHGRRSHDEVRANVEHILAAANNALPQP